MKSNDLWFDFSKNFRSIRIFASLLVLPFQYSSCLFLLPLTFLIGILPGDRLVIS